jgi:hypothetical protein
VPVYVTFQKGKTMKKLLFISFSLFLILSGVLIDRYITTFQKASADEDTQMLAQLKSKKNKNNDQWVVKIDETVINLGEFEREFNVHVYSLPIDETQKIKYESDLNNKKKFLTNLVNEYLIFKKALSEGLNKRKDVQDLLAAVERRAVIQVYLNEKIEPKLVDISDEEIERVYNQNKKLFAGVDIEVAQQQIKMQLLQRQYNDHLNDLIDQLKGEAKVVKNEEIDL